LYIIKIINLLNKIGVHLSEIKSLDEILEQREAREAIISTEEAEEIAAQEEIWAEQAKLEADEKEIEIEQNSTNQNFEELPSDHVYSKYEDIDKDQLQRDIEEIKEKLGPVGQSDFDHLLKLERWSRGATFAGFFLIYVITALEVSVGLNTFVFWALGIVAAVLIGVGNVTRWADITHPILHGAYDKVPNIPLKYKKKGYARGIRRYTDWLDWIQPAAWEYEHNIMHHYHLGEDDDPDNVERNMQWLIQSKIPMWLRKVFIYIFAMTWKFTYYAPNTMRILDNKERRRRKEPEITNYNYWPTTERGKRLWKDFYLPYQFSEPHKSQGEFYLRQIMGSVNYNTGTDLLDFAQGFLNYQIEHHLFPNTPQSYQQKMQPLVKEVCRKHNIEYRQESVFKRIGMTIDLMIGKTKLLRVDGI